MPKSQLPVASNGGDASVQEKDCPGKNLMGHVPFLFYSSLGALFACTK